MDSLRVFVVSRSSEAGWITGGASTVYKPPNSTLKTHIRACNFFFNSIEVKFFVAKGMCEDSTCFHLLVFVIEKRL